MQTPQQIPQTPAAVGFLPTIWNWLLQAILFTALFLVASQTLDLEYCSKEAKTSREVRTKIHYKGNVFIDLSKSQDK